MTILINIIIFLIIFYSVTVKSRKSLHMLQQNLYNENNRYLKWLKQNRKVALKHYDLMGLLLSVIALFTGNLFGKVLLIISAFI